MRQAFVTLALLEVARTANIPPQFATDRTVYHLNPASAGAIPVNMDTGDALGDLFFYLGQFLLPLECINVTAESRAHFDCDNPERSGDLVVTEVNMTIDSRTTGYSACNLCNGTDPFSGKTCKIGTYSCDCESKFHGPPCDNQMVGVTNITEQFAPAPPSAECQSAMTAQCGRVVREKHGCALCIGLHSTGLSKAGCSKHDLEKFCPSPWDQCRPDVPPVVPWACWAQNIPRKTGGFWYSTLSGSQCQAPGDLSIGDNIAHDNNCSWAVKSHKTIHEKCLKNKIITSVEAHDKAGCFASCSSAKRDISSPCWIGCFFDTLLGPGSSSSEPESLGGMAVIDVERSWTDAFLSEAEGGCPSLAIAEYVMAEK